MAHFARGGSSSGGAGRGGFKGGFRGGSDRGGDRDSRPVTMHSAKCDSCGKTCEVPFRPTGERPVYCRDCFAGRAAMGGDRSERKDYRSAPRDFAPGPQKVSGNNDEVKKQLETMNSKLERLFTSIQTLSDALIAKPAVVKTEEAPKKEKVSKKK